MPGLVKSGHVKADASLSSNRLRAGSTRSLESRSSLKWLSLLLFVGGPATWYIFFCVASGQTICRAGLRSNLNADVPSRMSVMGRDFTREC
jgi:hypothetical protein